MSSVIACGPGGEMILILAAPFLLVAVMLVATVVCTVCSISAGRRRTYARQRGFEVVFPPMAATTNWDRHE